MHTAYLALNIEDPVPPWLSRDISDNGCQPRMAVHPDIVPSFIVAGDAGHKPRSNLAPVPFTLQVAE